MAAILSNIAAYRPRVVDGQLAASLEAIGAVLVEGPKACGKTETARRAARSETRMDTPAASQAYAVDPALVLEGETPHLLDEWQVEPDLWNDVRHAVDDRQATGQFILTGSSVPRVDERRHSGAGRFIHVRMLPMTLAEAGFSSGKVSLAEVLAGRRVTAPDPGLAIGDLAERIACGGWPGLLGSPRPRRRARSRGTSTTSAESMSGASTAPAAIPPAFALSSPPWPGTPRAPSRSRRSPRTQAAPIAR